MQISFTDSMIPKQFHKFISKQYLGVINITCMQILHLYINV